MTFSFPLQDVTIKIVQEKILVTQPLYIDNYHQINQQEFYLDVKGIASFYARNGNYIEIQPHESYDLHTLELYLNGSVYGAILHQRKMVPLHGSSFIYKDKGIMICGESGAGKSSITAAFCFTGSRFLTDDVTPMVMEGGKPNMLTLSDRIKLWDDALEQLNLQNEGLIKINQHNEKFYFPIDKEATAKFPLNTLFVVEIHDKMEVEFRELKGAEKLTILRSQIYRLEYLKGMPENEAVFFHQLATISNNVNIIIIKRPFKIPIPDLMSLLKNYIDNTSICDKSHGCGSLML